jgi:MATE family multidrug resistance protein
MGAVPVAAHQIAINVASITFMGALGMAEATTVRVGYAVGAREPVAMRRAALAGFLIVVSMQSLTGIAMLFGNHAIASVYTQDAAVVALAANLLLFAAAFQLSDGVQVVAGAALRGLKDTRVPMLLTAFAYWGVGMSLGATLGFGLGWGPQGMWCGLVAGLTVAATLLSLRFRWLARRPLPEPS